MRTSLILLITFFGLVLSAQVTLVLDSIPQNTEENSGIYIAGNFQGWDPGHPEYRLNKDESGRWSIILPAMEEGTEIQFKFTQGSWETVEKGAEGEDVGNRSFIYGNDSTITTKIIMWATALAPPVSTAASNVSIVDEDFYMPQLDRYRRVWIYLPPDYDTSGKEYPVIYMHDGQGLFDNITAYMTEWQVDETLNELFLSGYQVPIVVGIDNGQLFRNDELMPWGNEEYGGGQGSEYLSFICNTLKPSIDSGFRTMPDRNSTAIMGSSLGGLISLYGAIEYPDVFAKCAPFSPAYWVVMDSLSTYLSASSKSNEISFYQVMGDQEGDTYAESMFEVEKLLVDIGYSRISSKIIEGGEHNENSWRKEFAEAYLWMFAGYANSLSENHQLLPLLLNLDSQAGILIVKNMELKEKDKIRIYDEEGKQVLKRKVTEPTESIPVSGFEDGKYRLILTRDGQEYWGRFMVGC